MPGAPTLDSEMGASREGANRGPRGQVFVRGVDNRGPRRARSNPNGPPAAES